MHSLINRVIKIDNYQRKQQKEHAARSFESGSPPCGNDPPPHALSHSLLSLEANGTNAGVLAGGVSACSFLSCLLQGTLLWVHERLWCEVLKLLTGALGTFLGAF